MRFEFDWDPAKADSNRRKHGVSFEDAMAVFGDPLALSLLDHESGQGEERWVTIGRHPASHLLLVVHTYVELSLERVAIRIISARRPTAREVRQYEEG
ncbi:MAG: BrnT family toxin [Xanthobacteraceae bacterium]|nr:BrnT family toxin [Xanthobacteraceae bacterium]